MRSVADKVGAAGTFLRALRPQKIGSVAAGTVNELSQQLNSRLFWNPELVGQSQVNECEKCDEMLESWEMSGAIEGLCGIFVPSEL